MSKPKILLQLDTDPQPSVFDAVVAADSGVDVLLRHGGVTPENVVGLVHGAIFTRGPDDLKHTAIFIGGSKVDAGAALLDKIRKVFVGPLRVSVMMDSNGANTTAAAAVLAVLKHVDPRRATVAVLGATGPVGFRAVWLLARQRATVRVCSRSLERATEVCRSVGQAQPEANVTPHAASTPEETAAAVHGATVILSAGAAGVRLLSPSVFQQLPGLQVAIDLNAVPPAGIEGIDPMDKAEVRGRIVCYGAVGVGGTKMKIHKAALAKLFTSNNLILDANEIFALGQTI
jgi:hypothetical protein